MARPVPDVLDPACATRRALERFSSKWTVLVVYALSAGPQRTAQLRRRIPGVTQKVLTDTLRTMASDGLVSRRVHKETAPQHVEYSLTELGDQLSTPLAAICDWAAGDTRPAGTESA
jgi:DNA-binding HxlR family transcriptional regulator